MKNEKINYIIDKNISLCKRYFLAIALPIIFFIINLKNKIMNKDDYKFLMILLKIFLVYLTVLAVMIFTMFNI